MQVDGRPRSLLAQLMDNTLVGKATDALWRVSTELSAHLLQLPAKACTEGCCPTHKYWKNTSRLHEIQQKDSHFLDMEDTDRGAPHHHPDLRRYANLNHAVDSDPCNPCCW